jgi:hypothetical protein
MRRYALEVLADAWSEGVTMAFPRLQGCVMIGQKCSRIA